MLNLSGSSGIRVLLSTLLVFLALPPGFAGAQMLSPIDAVELYEPADQLPPFGDPTSNQYFGGALAVGNFDGDLYQDLAIGIPGDTSGPLLGRRAEAGTVAILSGSPSGLAMSNSQYISQPWTGIDPAVQEAGDHFGCALAVGDFNADNVDDLAVGVCNETIGGVSLAGAVNVFYGVFNGPLGDPAFILTESSPVSGHQFGLSLAAGDINGDGFDDLVAADVQGVFYFWFGSGVGLTGTPTVFVGATAGVVGHSVAIGDFDGDGFDDFAWGGPWPAWTAGQVDVIPGTAAGLGNFLSNSLRQDFMVDDALDGGNEADDRFGETLLATDLNNDGYCDLVIGTPGEDVGGEGSEFVDAGAVYVLLGSPSGLDIASVRYWTEGSAGMMTVLADGDGFGMALAAGDSDEDGYQELVIGSPFKSVSGQAEAGLVSILPGSATGPTTLGLARSWHQDSPGVPDFSEVGDRFGRVLAFGDFEGNLYSDLAIASPDEDDGVGHPNLGVVTVLRGCLFCDGFEAGSFAAPSPVFWSAVAP
jgi:hypothetical protein